MPMLLFYRLLFMLELFTAEFIFINRLRKRKYFVLRYAACLVVGFALAAALPLIYNGFYTTFVFLLLFAVTVPMTAFCCNAPWRNIFFCGVAAYTMQHFAYGVANLLLALVREGQSPIFGMYFEGNFDINSFDAFTLIAALLYVLAYYVSYSALYFAFVRRIRRGEDFKIRSNAMMAVVGVGLIVDIVLNAVTVYLGDRSSVVVMVMSTVYESLCCLFLMYIQFELIKSENLKTELDFTQTMLREKERQYNLSKENIELINLKCHDLRHQIRSVGEKKDLPAEVVREIENAISIYDAKVCTDNEVLDIILTEKSLSCAMDGITLTCVADGRSLEFMDKTDVYALFGNALDNAIEAVRRLPESERNIGVVVRSIGEMVSVNVRNSCDGNVKFGSDGFPLTSKENNGFHGIGIKSIRNIAEKYHGVSSVSVKDNTFNLNVLLAK